MQKSKSQFNKLLSYFKSFRALELSSFQKGFSLIELIIYIAIFAVVIAVGTQLLGVTNRIRSQTESRYEVQQNIRFAVEKISEQIRKASAISAPVTGTPADILTLTVSGQQVDFQIVSGVLQMREGVANPWQNLTTENVIVSAISVGNLFTKIDNSPAKSSVQIKMKIDYNNQGRPDFIHSMQIQTTVSLH